MMSHLRTQEVLYESEAALRLVDHGLQGLRDDPLELLDVDVENDPAGAQLSALLLLANGELDQALAAIRQSREALTTLSVDGTATVAPRVTARLAETTNALLATEQRLQALTAQLQAQRHAADGDVIAR